MFPKEGDTLYHGRGTVPEVFGRRILHIIAIIIKHRARAQTVYLA